MRSESFRWLIRVFLVAVILSVGGAVTAPTAAPSESWGYEVTPYLWGVGLNGNTAVGTLPAQGVEASFSDLLKVLDVAGLVAFEGRRGRWGFLVDALYFHLSDSTPTPEAAFGDAEVDLKQQLYSAAAVRRVLDGRTSVDLIFGARYSDIANELELTSGVAAGRRKSGSFDWWDAIGGARVGWAFADQWKLIGYGGLSGGGSSLSGQVQVGVDWRFSPHLTGRFGYRYLKMDYDHDEFLYDMAMAGGYAGLGIRFGSAADPSKSP